MYSRHDIKNRAKISFKKHYILFITVCILMGFLGSGGNNLTKGMHINTQKEQMGDTVTQSGTSSIPVSGLSDILNGRSISRIIDSDEIFGHSRGVFAVIANTISSGTIVVTMISAISSVIGSKSIATAITVFVGFVIILALWVFLINVFRAVAARIFMEGRVYESVPIHRFIFFIRVKKWSKASFTMLRCTIYQTLWWITIAGGIIKAFSYRMVPYIVAENPDIPAGKAITLSRRMMNGHKWECFILELSFIGWNILDIITFGIVGTLFLKAYKEAALCEYYAHIRNLAKENNIQDSEYLNDEYLYQKAGRAEIEDAYADVMKLISAPEPVVKERKGILGFIANVFGVVLFEDKTEKEYQENMANKVKIRNIKNVIDGKAYPGRLYTIPEKEKRKKLSNIQYIRHYSVWSLIIMYFIFSFAGWVWEVSLHLVSDGEFVNRGVLHGPWLPIYGMGGILILVLLNKFRSKPVLEFISTVIVCGCVEYYTSWYLEMTHNGQKWWDYTGYFINLNGRICAEGLLVFGIGGITVVYLVAPMLDNLIRKINIKILVPLCVILISLYTADQIYSNRHPNTGKGITDYAYTGYIIPDKYI